MKNKNCSICGTVYQGGWWHNSEPVVKGLCCDGCNSAVVIPYRLDLIKKGLYKTVKSYSGYKRIKYK